MPVKSEEIINIHDAKTHFSRLLERVAAGETIIIAKAGKPIAKLEKFEAQRPVFGALKGQFGDIDDLLDTPVKWNLDEPIDPYDR